jgi:DNA-binding winged helix-turn-helix (wHTH) protein/pimeloyl-ACP methyl ester carboxylesterase
MRYLFGDYALDASRRELARSGSPIHVEPQVFDLVLYLIQNRGRVVSKDDLLENVWDGRIVSESTLSNRISVARQAIGDSGEQQELIKTIARRGLRFVGEVREEALHSLAAAAAVPAVAEKPAAVLLRPAAVPQEVTFCRTSDGVNLALATSGSGMPVVKATNWLNHIEFDWQSPMWLPLFTRLSERFRLVRYDGRANGLSDWDVKELSLEAAVRDMETVVDTLGLERFALFGISYGAAVSISYATRHPERVSRLILSGGYAQGWVGRGNPEEIARRAALVALIRNGWGMDNPAFRQVFTSCYVPDATAEEMKWFNDLQRMSASPENAARLMEIYSEIDVLDLLPRVTAPTLVLHSRGDAAIPFAQGLVLARGIANARFVALDSNNHLVLSHEPAWERYTQEICDFLSAAEPG